MFCEFKFCRLCQLSATTERHSSMHNITSNTISWIKYAVNTVKICFHIEGLFGYKPTFFCCVVISVTQIEPCYFTLLLPHEN